MISTAALEAMAAAGCSAEQLVAVIKADSAAKEAAAVLRREKDKERKRAARSAEKTAQVSADVQECPAESTMSARTDADNADSSGQCGNGFSLSPVPLLPPTPPNNPLTPKPSSKNSKTRAHRLPENAEISGPDLAFGLSRGLSEAETCELWGRMASWAWSAGGPNASKVNWHQAFQGWVRRDGPGIIASRRGKTGKPLTEHQRKQHETQDILDDIDNLIGRSSQGRSQDIGLLPDYSGERSEAVCSGPDQGFDWVPAGSG